MTEDWISITEAAARLAATGDKIDRSTLSRYLKQHAEALPTKRDGRQNLVDFARLQAHRSENVRIAVAAPAVETETAASGSKFRGTQADGAARKAMADAELRELDLAERRRELTVVPEVDRAARDAIALMRAAFDRAVETEASVYAHKHGWDERTARIALKEFARMGLSVFHEEIMKRLDMARRAAETGEAPGDEAAAALQ